MTLQRKVVQRAAMDRQFCPEAQQSLDSMMLDSETTSHLTSYDDPIKSKTQCNIRIALVDDSRVEKYAKGVRPACVSTEKGSKRVNFNNTLLELDASLKFFLVPASVEKGMSVMLILRKANIFKLENDFSL